MSDPDYSIVPPRDLFYGTSGPRDADIAIIAESWGWEEEQAEAPLVGGSGREFDRMLAEAGIDRASCFLTNVISARPKDNDAWRFFLPNPSPATYHGLAPTPFALSEIERSHQQLREVHPKLVIAVGNYALWSTAILSGAQWGSISSTSNGEGATVRVPSGIASWRGSMLTSKQSVSSGTTPGRVLPVIHPAAVLRDWALRPSLVHDLSRIRQLDNDWEPKPPGPLIWAPPTFDQAVAQFKAWLKWMDAGNKLRIAHDIETYKRTLITCMGFATGPYDHTGFAMVIPFVRLVGRGMLESYWDVDQEIILNALISRVLTHPNVLVEGQNYIYDVQYMQLFYGITPRLDFDTMSANHLLFPGTPKGLDYLSSLYCRYHVYWKDDNKEWDTKEGETTHLLYNAVDVLRTYECATTLRELIVQLGQAEQWEWQKKKWWLALRMMNRGVRIDRDRRSRYAVDLAVAKTNIETQLDYIAPMEWVEQKKEKTKWYNSPTQTRDFFYETLGLTKQKNRKTGALSTDDEAIQTLIVKHPEHRAMFDRILALRSINVFAKTFIAAKLEHNGRWVAQFNPDGTETFRWSSSKNVFDRGNNLQNVPAGEEE